MRVPAIMDLSSLAEMHAEVISRPPFFNFSDVSHIDQLMRTFEVHARFITARIGVQFCPL